jgi:choline dehydrogenase
MSYDTLPEEDRMSQPFDTIIVGAGPAGCVLAHRLTEDGTRNVLLIEAGPDYGSDPHDWPPELLNPDSVVLDSHLWGYANATAPVDLTRARIVGGTSTVNGCLWIRGSAVDYDTWAELGNDEWSFAGLLPYFQRAENDPIAGDLHGHEGLVPVYRTPEAAWTTLDHAIVDAAVHLGLERHDDLNGTREQRPMVGPTPKNVASGTRMNAAFTYLAAARSSPNFTLLANTLIDRMIVENGRATGLLTDSGERYDASEVILSAGAYGSPSILMRSGIGPADHLKALDIPVVVDLPGVGQHLMDHPLVGGLLECEIAPGYEAAAATFSPVMIKARSSQIDREIDLHIYQGQVLNQETGRWNLWFSVSLQYARARGHLRLASRDPNQLAIVDHGYFSDPEDLEALCDGVEFVNQLIESPPLDEIVERIPGKSLQWAGRDDLRAKVRAQVGTTYHPSSTCRMGPSSDPMAVVDQAGRVHGIERLRIVDASIFPTGPHGNLHFPVVAAAEKIADSF